MLIYSLSMHQSKMTKTSVDLIFLLSSFNRKEKTLGLIHDLLASVRNYSFLIVVVDNNSTDGTQEDLVALNEVSLTIITTPKDMYWSQSMSFGYEYVAKRINYSFLVALNDDIKLFNSWFNIFSRELAYMNKRLCVHAYSFVDENGHHSYGGLNSVYRLMKTKLKPVYPNGELQLVDTINFNFVIIPRALLDKEGFLYKRYIHGLADFDFGFKIRSRGYPIFISGEYLGTCNRNTISGTSADKSLRFIERIKRLHGKKEQPLIPRIYYYLRNDKFVSFVSFFLVYLSFLKSKLSDISCNTHL